MEREIYIRHAGVYFGNLTFYYENYFNGTVHVSRKTPRQVTVENFTEVDLVELHSRLDRFEHKQVSPEHLLDLDKSFVLHYFSDEIESNSIDPRDLNVFPAEDIYFHKTLFDQDRGVIGSVKITVNCSNQTKNYYFKPLCPELKSLEERFQRPFNQINRHILFEFLHENVRPHFPNAFFW